MEKQDVLRLSVENGFFLDRGMLDFFVELSEEKFKGIVKELKGFGISEKILTLEVFGRYKDRFGFVSGDSKRESGVKVLKDIKKNSEKLEVRDFVSYFKNRFEEIRDILIKKSGVENLSSIRRVGRENGVFNIVGQVYDKRITKNKNLLLEVEDLTGRIVVLVNRDNKELFERARGLLLDDIVCFKCSGSSKMLFISDFIYPDSCLDSEKFGDKDEFVAFVSDLHIGSNGFLEESFMKFVDWLNGEVGDSRQKGIAGRVKYLVLSGDNIEGVGVYPGQEKFLKIKGILGQYKELARVLGKVRKDVEIIMIPGLHDAVWVGEPMPSVNKKWVEELEGLGNLKMVSNPCVVEIGGLSILNYHSGSLNKFIELIEGFRVRYGHRCPIKVVEEILKRRHLAPVYGEMDIIPNKEGDDLVLTDLPDVFVVGGQHRVQVGNYNNILTISTSCFQKQTDFEKRVGHEPDFARVPILNLKSREVKILDFGDEEIKWEEGKDLVCELGGKNEKVF